MPKLFKHPASDHDHARRDHQDHGYGCEPLDHVSGGHDRERVCLGRRAYDRDCVDEYDRDDGYDCVRVDARCHHAYVRGCEHECADGRGDAYVRGVPYPDSNLI